MQSCPCGSEKEYQACCEVFHKGTPPENALLLMRSRYSAYVLNIPDYIMATTHPTSPQYSENRFSWKRSISQFSRNSHFEKLVVHDYKENGNFATVTFTAHFTQEGQDASFTERSFFEKVKNVWYYRNGRFIPGPDAKLIYDDKLDLLPIAYYGNPILRKAGEAIPEITEEIKTLVNQMVETMDTSLGMGLAAPQVHHSLRLFVIRTPIEDGHGYFTLGDIKVFINPKLSAFSEESWSASEGCISIPGLRNNVDRPKEVTVEYMSLDGKVHTERFSGWEAKVIFHENDHIDGILFIDRLDKADQSKFAPTLRGLERRMANFLGNP